MATVATATASTAEVVSMTRRRGTRSATTPAGSSMTSVPIRVAPLTRPGLAADPVAARISSG